MSMIGLVIALLAGIWLGAAAAAVQAKVHNWWFSFVLSMPAISFFSWAVMFASVDRVAEFDLLRVPPGFIGAMFAVLLAFALLLVAADAELLPVSLDVEETGVDELVLPIYFASLCLALAALVVPWALWASPVGPVDSLVEAYLAVPVPTLGASCFVVLGGVFWAIAVTEWDPLGGAWAIEGHGSDVTVEDIQGPALLTGFTVVFAFATLWGTIDGPAGSIVVPIDSVTSYPVGLILGWSAVAIWSMRSDVRRQQSELADTILPRIEQQYSNVPDYEPIDQALGSVRATLRRGEIERTKNTLDQVASLLEVLSGLHQYNESIEAIPNCNLEPYDVDQLSTVDSQYFDDSEATLAWRSDKLPSELTRARRQLDEYLESHVQSAKDALDVVRSRHPDIDTDQFHGGSRVDDVTLRASEPPGALVRKSSSLARSAQSSRTPEVYAKAVSAARMARVALLETLVVSARDRLETAAQGRDTPEETMLELQEGERIADTGLELLDEHDWEERSELRGSLKETRHEASAQRDALLDELESDATHALEAGEASFERGEAEEAARELRRARDQFDRLVEIAGRLGDHSVEPFESKRDQATRRLDYCRLAAAADGLESARDAIEDDPTRAEDRFQEIVEDLIGYEVFNDDLESEHEELLEEARRGRDRAGLAVGRAMIREAEDTYDDGRLQPAQSQYREAIGRIESLKGEGVRNGGDFEDEAEQLLRLCNENVRHIDRELTGVARVRGGGALLRLDQLEREPNDQRDATRNRSASSDDWHTDATSRIGRAPPNHERVDLLGEGGNAQVYHVRLTDTGTEAALKVPQWTGTLAESDIERFFNEAETWSRIDDHENIVTVYDWGFDAEPWILMEYMAGGDLEGAGGGLSIDRVLEILIAIADALHYARGVDHLDVKPDNVLLDAEGTPKLADWGLARVAFQHTGTDTRMGLSPPYAAPEQVDRTLGDRDHLTDIYQLGATGYELLTGTPPFDPDAPESLERRILEETPQAPSDLRTEVPEALDAVLLKALAKDPSDRYEAVIQFRDALREVRDST